MQPAHKSQTESQLEQWAPIFLIFVGLHLFFIIMLSGQAEQTFRDRYPSGFTDPTPHLAWFVGRWGAVANALVLFPALCLAGTGRGEARWLVLGCSVLLWRAGTYSIVWLGYWRAL